AIAAEVVPEVLSAEAKRIAAIERMSASTLAIFSNTTGQGGGSGVVISPDGYALTNYHVCNPWGPSGPHFKCGMNDGKLYDAVIVGVDPVGDVALIKLIGRDDFPAATLGDSDKVRVGDWCYTVGNPFLLATDFRPSVARGIVSGVNRYQYPAGTLLEYADCIQTDAAINPGNSGGPLFDSDGNVIGINGRGSFEKRGRINVGVGYAISINQIKNFLGYLKSGRIVDHATLNAIVAPDDQGNVVVTEILDTSDAYRRGLRYDDQILQFGDRRIGTVNAMKNVLGIYPQGWRVPLSFRRDTETFDVFVRLKGIHHRGQLVDLVEGRKRAPARKGDQPDDGKPKDESPAPMLPKPKKPAKAKPLPPAVKKLYTQRDGYANYYFNDLNQRRVWSALAKNGEFSTTADHWEIKTKTSREQILSITFDSKSGTYQLPVNELVVDFTRELGSDLAPKGSGGMLLALHLWQRLLRLGIDKYGEVYYLGTMPLAEDAAWREGRHYDVLVANHEGVESRFMLDPKNGRIVAMEMTPSDGVDPCEIRFDDYRQVDGRQLPHRLTVRNGERLFDAYQVESYDIKDE
ncbi:MAG: trypsin-like peptidase domain-containing protein, partial [Pirellulales bacterium]|nr:trypsin-like peptidase domain-containing protein [Pirellulales bacterium]